MKRRFIFSILIAWALCAPQAVYEDYKSAQICSVTAGNPTTITTCNPHGLVNQSWVNFWGFVSQGSANGDWVNLNNQQAAHTRFPLGTAQTRAYVSDTTQFETTLGATWNVTAGGLSNCSGYTTGNESGSISVTTRPSLSTIAANVTAPVGRQVLGTAKISGNAHVEKGNGWRAQQRHKDLTSAKST